MKKGTRIWTCDGCGKRETWRKGWGWLTGIPSLQNKDDDPTVVYPLATCSSACEDVALKRVMHMPDPPWP